MPPPPKHRWLWLSRHDPWNPVFARYAGFLAWVQWAVILLWAIWPYSFFYTRPETQCKVAGVVTLLALIGYRGVVGGHANRPGSFILLATNVSLLAIHMLVHLRSLSMIYSR